MDGGRLRFFTFEGFVTFFHADIHLRTVHTWTWGLLVHKYVIILLTQLPHSLGEVWGRPCWSLDLDWVWCPTELPWTNTYTHRSDVQLVWPTLWQYSQEFVRGPREENSVR